MQVEVGLHQDQSAAAVLVAMVPWEAALVGLRQGKGVVSWVVDRYFHEVVSVSVSVLYGL